MQSLPSQPPTVQTSYRIRQCTDKSDANILHTFVRELSESVGMLDMVKLTADDLVRDGFSHPNPLFYAAIAECKSVGSDHWEPIGCITWYYAYSTWNGKTLFVEDLYVREKYRRHGLGKRLFGHCVKIAQDGNCSLIEWIVLRHNKAAKVMYESIGGIYPQDGDWDLMRMDAKSMVTFMDSHYQA